ncbi:MAG: hypothetical protein WCI21_04435, partial [Alphaproteobacteria bacterium]
IVADAQKLPLGRWNDVGKTAFQIPDDTPWDMHDLVLTFDTTVGESQRIWGQAVCVRPPLPAEFFVAAAISATFLFTMLHGWKAAGLDGMAWSIGGLVAGGIVAAPIAGWTTKVLPLRLLTWLTGLLVVGLAVWQGIQLARHH